MGYNLSMYLSEISGLDLMFSTSMKISAREVFLECSNSKTWLRFVQYSGVTVIDGV